MARRYWPEEPEERARRFKAFGIDVSKEPEGKYPIRFGEFLSLYTVSKSSPKSDNDEEFLDKYKQWFKVDRDGSGVI